MLVTCPREIFITFKSLEENSRQEEFVDDYRTKRTNDKWKKQGIIQFATWNVQGLSYKEDQLDDILAKKGIKIAAVTETKKKLKGSRETNNYIQLYSGVNRQERAKAGVIVMIHKSLRSCINNYKFWNERIIEVRIKLTRGFMTIFGLYAPVEGDEQNSELFYNDLQTIISKVPKSDMLLLLGDLNARIGNKEVRGHIGKHGEAVCNNNGQRLRDFVVYNNLKVMNSFFKHKQIHSYTWHGRGTQSIIDYVICNAKLFSYVLDVKACRGPEIETDHYLVVAPIRIPARWYKTRNKNNSVKEENLKFKVNLLRDPSIRGLYENRIKQHLQNIKLSDNIEEEWENLTNILKHAATESLGLTKRRCKNRRGILKWDENIKKVINDKREAYLKFLQSKKLEDEIDYKAKRAIAKRETRKKHRESWNTFVAKLERDLTLPKPNTFKILKKLNSDLKENVIINPIPKNTLVNYFQNLWFQRNCSLNTQSSSNDTVTHISYEELITVYKKSKNGKAPGEDGLNIELFKYAGEDFTYRFLYFLNNIWKGQDPPKSWQKAIIIPIYKKGDKTKCENYRGISLLNSGYKFYANVIKNKLSPFYEDFITEEQNGFRKGRSCCDSYFTMKILIEKHREFNVETHLAFIDFEKAFDTINRNKLLEILAYDNVPNQIISSIYNLYCHNKISIKTERDTSDWVQINQGVRQGCGLSPLLFIIYMNHILKIWRQNHHAGILLNKNVCLDTLLFADDQVIIAKSEDELQRAVFNLQTTASKFNMKISSEKTKVMAFAGKFPIPSKIIINNKLIERVNSFCYLGYNLSFDNEEDMAIKISKFVKITGVINSVFKPSRVQRHTRLRVYKTLARPVLSYGSEAWTIRKNDERRLTSAEMRFMRRTAGCSLLEHRRNEDILKELKIEPITHFIRQYRLQWKEHVARMNEKRWPRQILAYAPKGRRDLGRPKKRWKESVTDPQGSNT